MRRRAGSVVHHKRGRSSDSSIGQENINKSNSNSTHITNNYGDNSNVAKIVIDTLSDNFSNNFEERKSISGLQSKSDNNVGAGRLSHSGGKNNNRLSKYIYIFCMFFCPSFLKIFFLFPLNIILLLF